MSKHEIKRWEVWYAEFPYEEDENIVKKRPVIVINVDTLEVLSVKVTSQDARDEDEFDTPLTYWKEAGLKKPSVARISKSMNLSIENFFNKKGEIHNDDRILIEQRFMDFVNSFK